MSGVLDHLIGRLTGQGETVRARKPEPFANEPAGDLEVQDDEAVTPPSGIAQALRAAPPATPAGAGDVSHARGPEPAPDRPRGPPPGTRASPKTADSSTLESDAPAPQRATHAPADPPAPVTAAASPPPAAPAAAHTRESYVEHRSEVTEVFEVTRLDSVTETEVLHVTRAGDEPQPPRSDSDRARVAQAPAAAAPLADTRPAPILTQPPAVLAAQDGIGLSATATLPREREPELASQPLRIEIGRVEIHVPRQGAPVRPTRRPAPDRPGAMSLEAYLASKGGGS